MVALVPIAVWKRSAKLNTAVSTVSFVTVGTASPSAAPAAGANIDSSSGGVRTPLSIIFFCTTTAFLIFSIEGRAESPVCSWLPVWFCV